MDKEVVIIRLRKLVDDFKSRYDYYHSLSEADIETKLIEELFINVLGWSKGDFNKQERAKRGKSSGRADYTFRLGDKIVFYLEVKKIGVTLEKEADKQVISYALSKRIPFAVSTNFEELKIFCVEQEDALYNTFWGFHNPEEYITSFDILFYLSKESFEQNLILKKAESDGRLKKRVSIDKALLEDLMHVRKLISDDIEKRYPSKYQINEKDEIVQRILDRLIFIRHCEDTGISPDGISIEDLRHLSHDKCYPKLKEIFKRYNEVYNSGLFAVSYDNDCDKIDLNGGIIQKLAYYLYQSKDEKYIYNFDWIDADVLGQVYEQYLGKLLQQTKSGKSKLKEGQAHKKEQGIYYTPTYIVDYIVKNTVGELLKDKKCDPAKIKILDPACGSGSFLIKAYECLAKHVTGKDDQSSQHRLDEQGHYSVKTEILKNNIYGVDLDQKAVEITKLNLLLKAAEKNRKLPDEVDLHIKHGNSLVADNNIDKNAFKWIGDFEEGTFDIILGNPPYFKIFEDNLVNKTKDYLEIKNGMMNISAVFINRFMKFLKPMGYMGMIVPKMLAFTDSWAKLRDKMLSECELIRVVDCGKAFKDVLLEQVVFVIRKKVPNTNSKVTIGEINRDKIIETAKISQQLCKNENSIYLESNSIGYLIKNKMESNSIKLGTIAKIVLGLGIQGMDLFKDEYEKGNEKVLRGNDIQRYLIRGSKYYNPSDKNLIEYSKIINSFKKKHIVVQRIVAHIKDHIKLTAALDEDGLFSFNTVTNIFVNDKVYKEKYVLAILNSKPVQYYTYKFIYQNAIRSMDFYKAYAKKIPIPKVDDITQEKISKLVEFLLSLNKKIFDFGDKQTTEKAKLQSEITKIEHEIDEFAYKLYALTGEEKKVIEDSLK